jgi:chitosanase
MVFSKYKDLIDNDVIADKLLEYKKQSCKGTLPDDDAFLKLIHKACEDQEFKDAQDAIYDKVYWSRGEAWFDQNGFKLPLSMAVIQDSYLQSGEILDFLRKRFSAKTPANGGDEKEWIIQYVDTRNSWLENHSRQILRNTTYRTRFFKDQIKKDNWNLNKIPIYANGIKIA